MSIDEWTFKSLALFHHAGIKEWENIMNLRYSRNFYLCNFMHWKVSKPFVQRNPFNCPKLSFFSSLFDQRTHLTRSIHKHFEKNQVKAAQFEELLSRVMALFKFFKKFLVVAGSQSSHRKLDTFNNQNGVRHGLSWYAQHSLGCNSLSWSFFFFLCYSLLCLTFACFVAMGA